MEHNTTLDRLNAFYYNYLAAGASVIGTIGKVILAFGTLGTLFVLPLVLLAN